MKISWGIIIIAVFVFFAGGIGIMVGVSMSKNSDLVTENYYETQLKHQDKIYMMKRTNQLKDKVNLNIENEMLTIKYPDDFVSENISGKIYFYRAMDKKKDFTVDIHKDRKSIQEISTVKMDKGHWKIQIQWNASSKEYFYESDIFIN